MKIFNVSLRVVITQIAEIPDNPPEPPAEPAAKFNDDPLDKQDKMLNKYLDRMAGLVAPRPVVTYGEQPDGASLTKSVRVQAETFEDLDAILRMFSDTTKAIRPVPDEILRAATPTPATPGIPGQWG